MNQRSIVCPIATDWVTITPGAGASTIDKITVFSPRHVVSHSYDDVIRSGVATVCAKAFHIWGFHYFTRYTLGRWPSEVHDSKEFV